MSSVSPEFTSEKLRQIPELVEVTPNGEVLNDYINQLEKTVYGQTRACREIARALTRSVAGLGDSDKPEFVGMFLGAPGTGKTEMGRAMAKILSKDGNCLRVIDCSTFSDEFDVHKLTGSNPGYVGYGDKPLIDPDFLERRNVIVFDEIEKANVALHRVLLQVMDKGQLVVPIGTSTYKDVKNTVLNFRQSTIIFTSNVGSSEIQEKKLQRPVGFICKSEESAADFEIGIKAMKKRWRQMPEFVNRLDAVVVFDPLTPEAFGKIFDKFINEYNSCQIHGINPIACTNEVREWILGKADIKLGGRELKRVLNKLLITPAAEVKLSLMENQPIIVDVREDRPVFFTLSLRQPEKPKDEKPAVKEESEERKKKFPNTDTENAEDIESIDGSGRDKFDD